MSVVGFDLGNESYVVAVARQRGIDVVNDESKRETPALVCFGDKQRFLGTAGAATIMSNPKNDISQIKRLIGRPFSDPELQQDLKSLPFSVTEGPDGFPLIHVQYLGEKKAFTPIQLNVAFVDIGHASMQVCIAGFKKGQLKVLAHSFDRCLGGRDFGEILFQHFVEKFKVEY
nr:heat shock 70 kDa protein 15-like [Tanacetum cinerariifolium]